MATEAKSLNEPEDTRPFDNAISGRLHVVMNDGTELEINGGDAYAISPGHDAWVEGEDTFSGVEFESLADYAKG